MCTYYLCYSSLMHVSREMFSCTRIGCYVSNDKVTPSSLLDRAYIASRAIVNEYHVEVCRISLFCAINGWS